MAAKYIEVASVPHQRFTDAENETGEYLLPIDGYQDSPLLSLEETMKPLEKLIASNKSVNKSTTPVQSNQKLIDPDIQTKIRIAKKRCKNVKDGLSQDESCAIQVYTMEATKSEQSLYYNLNQTLRKKDRGQLTPYLLYMKLLLTALWKLPSFSGHVWRGVNGDLSKDFQKGETIVWWGFSSCTTSLEVLESPQFLGKDETRTLFSVECKNGKVIKHHSYFAVEDEVLLLPGIELLITGKLRPAPGLTIIELREVIDSEVILLQPPFLQVTTGSQSTLASSTTPKGILQKQDFVCQWEKNNKKIKDDYYAVADLAARGKYSLGLLHFVKNVALWFPFSHRHLERRQIVQLRRRST